MPCTLGLALLFSGCAYLEDMFRQKPQALLPAQDLYQAGEQDMNKKYYPQARASFMSFYPRHDIADLVQFRLAMSYYDQLKPVEQDQGLTVKAMDQLKKLVREYPDSRYASDALAKIDVCRGRLAQKELWVAAYYLENENNPVAARQRLEGVLKNYPRSLVVPETLYRLADINAREGRTDEAQQMFKKLSDEYPYTEWGRRAGLRLQAAATR